MSNENINSAVAVTPLGAYLFRIAIGLFLVGLLLAYGMSFQVNEGTQTVVTRFDKPMRTVTKAGLYWKLPWPIEKAHAIDMRKRLFNTPQTATFTRDQNSIQLLTYVAWRVSNPLLFIQSLGSGDTLSEESLVREAQKKLESSVVAGKNRYMGQYDLSSLISTTESDIHAEDIEKLILKDVKEDALKTYGIEVLQVGIKRLAFPENNMKSILTKMRSERRALAGELRSQGEKEASKILDEAKLKSEQYRTEGRIEQGRIIGEAEKEATSIDAKANSFDPEFYTFWRSMQTLRKTLSGNATIVLRNDNEFFRALFEAPAKTGLIGPQTSPAPNPVDTPPAAAPNQAAPNQAAPPAEVPAPAAQSSFDRSEPQFIARTPVEILKTIPVDLITLK